MIKVPLIPVQKLSKVNEHQQQELLSAFKLLTKVQVELALSSKSKGIFGLEEDWRILYQIRLDLLEWLKTHNIHENSVNGSFR